MLLADRVSAVSAQALLTIHRPCSVVVRNGCRPGSGVVHVARSAHHTPLTVCLALHRVRHATCNRVSRDLRVRFWGCGFGGCAWLLTPRVHLGFHLGIHLGVTRRGWLRQRPPEGREGPIIAAGYTRVLFARSARTLVLCGVLFAPVRQDLGPCRVSSSRRDPSSLSPTSSAMCTKSGGFLWQN